VIHLLFCVHAELGINLTHIRVKTLAVLNPMSRLEPEIIGDRDLAGPIMFCLLLGAILLLVRTRRPLPPLPLRLL
jgi:hypothetical protein